MEVPRAAGSRDFYMKLSEARKDICVITNFLAYHAISLHNIMTAVKQRNMLLRCLDNDIKKELCQIFMALGDGIWLIKCHD